MRTLVAFCVAALSLSFAVVSTAQKPEKTTAEPAPDARMDKLEKKVEVHEHRIDKLERGTAPRADKLSQKQLNALDEIQDKVQQFGSAGMSDLVMIKDAGQFAIDYKEDPKDYVDKARAGLQGAARRSVERAFEYVGARDTQVDAAAIAAAAAGIPAGSLLSTGAGSTNTASGVEASLKDSKSASDSSGGSDQKDSTEDPPVQNDLKLDFARPAKDTLSSPKFSAPLPIGTLPSAISERQALMIGLNDKMIENILNFLGRPNGTKDNATAIGENKKIYLAVAEISVSPGWRTRKDFIADLAITAEYAQFPDRNPGMDGFPGVRNFFDHPFETERKPNILATFPFLEAQTLDLRNSERDQIAIAQQLAMLMTFQGNKTQSKQLMDFVRRREFDAATRSPVPTVASYATANTFGFQFMPIFQALGTPSNPKKGTEAVLNPYSFPALILIECDKDDIISTEEEWDGWTAGLRVAALLDEGTKDQLDKTKKTIEAHHKQQTANLDNAIALLLEGADRNVKKKYEEVAIKLIEINFDRKTDFLKTCEALGAQCPDRKNPQNLPLRFTGSDQLWNLDALIEAAARHRDLFKLLFDAARVTRNESRISGPPSPDARAESIKPPQDLIRSQPPSSGPTLDLIVDSLNALEQYVALLRSWIEADLRAEAIVKLTPPSGVSQNSSNDSKVNQWRSLILDERINASDYTLLIGRIGSSLARLATIRESFSKDEDYLVSQFATIAKAIDDAAANTNANKPAEAKKYLDDAVTAIKKLDDDTSRAKCLKGKSVASIKEARDALGEAMKYVTAVPFNSEKAAKEIATAKDKIQYALILAANCIEAQWSEFRTRNKFDQVLVSLRLDLFDLRIRLAIDLDRIPELQQVDLSAHEIERRVDSPEFLEWRVDNVAPAVEAGKIADRKAKQWVDALTKAPDVIYRNTDIQFHANYRWIPNNKDKTGWRIRQVFPREYKPSDRIEFAEKLRDMSHDFIKDPLPDPDVYQTEVRGQMLALKNAALGSSRSYRLPLEPRKTEAKKPDPPKIKTISPATGWLNEDTTIAIEGENFKSGDKDIVIGVMVDGRAAKSITASDKAIIAQIPPFNDVAHRNKEQDKATVTVLTTGGVAEKTNVIFFGREYTQLPKNPRINIERSADGLITGVQLIDPNDKSFASLEEIVKNGRMEPNAKINILRTNVPPKDPEKTTSTSTEKTTQSVDTSKANAPVTTTVKETTNESTKGPAPVVKVDVGTTTTKK